MKCIKRDAEAKIFEIPFATFTGNRGHITVQDRKECFKLNGHDQP